MNHLDPLFQQASKKQIESLIAHFPLAEIITSTKDNILVSELPLVKHKNELLGHIANQNPQLEHFKKSKKVKVVFSGPQAYMSPSLFETQELPTFNFARLHIDGEISLKSATDMLGDIKKLYRSLDTSVDALFKTQEHKIQHLSQYITGFCINITKIDFRFKLSQDKSPQHQRVALEALNKRSNEAVTQYCENFIKAYLPKS